MSKRTSYLSSLVAGVCLALALCGGCDDRYDASGVSAPTVDADGGGFDSVPLTEAEILHHPVDPELLADYEELSRR